MKQQYETMKDDCITGSLVRNKKASFQELSAIAKSLVVFGIILGLGILILVSFRDTTTVNSLAYNEMTAVLGLFTDLRTWGAIILIVIVGYLILRYLDVFGRE